jgi:hypothetical protein
VIVAEREVAEFHGPLPSLWRLICGRTILVSGDNNAFAIVVNASVWTTLGR